MSLFMMTQKAYSATQGTLGATSTGSKDISITINSKVQISNIDDYTVADWSSGDGTLEDNDNVCVYSNAGTGQYKITADSGDGTGSFTLDSGGTKLDYAVAWNAASGGTFAGGSALSDATESSTFGGADTASTSCATAGDTATVSLQILQADLEAVSGTTTPFTDTLTLTVTPI